MQTNEDVATVTRNGMVNIPARIREKYRIKPGTKIKFILDEDGLRMIPIIPLSELAGIDEDRKEIVYQMIRDISADRRREAKADRERL